MLNSIKRYLKRVAMPAMDGSWLVRPDMCEEVERRLLEIISTEGDKYIVTYRDEEQDWPAGEFDTLEKARECSEALTNDGYNAFISRVSRYLDNTNR